MHGFVSSRRLRRTSCLGGEEGEVEKVAEEVCGASVERLSLLKSQFLDTRRLSTLPLWCLSCCGTYQSTLGSRWNAVGSCLGSVVKPVEVVGSTDHDMSLRGLKRAIRRLIGATQNCEDYAASAVKLVAARESP